MAEFINFEAADPDENENEIIDEAAFDDPMMIDDSDDLPNNEPSFYRFHNQTTDAGEVMARIREEQRDALQHLEPHNYLEGLEDVEGELDEEASNEINKDKFLKTLVNPVKEQTKENSFFSALIYAINFQFHKEREEFSDEEIKTKIGEKFFDKLKAQEENCILDLDRSNFENMCFDLNEILLEFNLFLRVYERKDKFRYLFHQTEEKNNAIKTLSCCLHVKFNGFNVAAPYLENSQKKELLPIDIIYEPVRNPTQIIKCFFPKDMRFAYVGKIANWRGDTNVTNRPYECYYCQKYFARKKTFDSHVKNCSGKPGIVYNFNIQNIVTYEDNLKYVGDLPFSIYADFETSAPNCDFTCPENSTMFAVSYALVFTWHPKLNLPRQCVVRGFNHTVESLTDLSYLTEEQLYLRKQTTTEQLRDAAIEVSKRQNKNAINLLFNVELKFACDILQKWYNFKIKPGNLDISLLKRLKYERENPLTTDSKCAICHFPIKVNTKGLSFDKNDISYLDFLIRKEHAFIRNIFNESELKKSKKISSLEKSQTAMESFIHLVRVAEQEIKVVGSYDMIFDDKLREFLMEIAPAYEYDLPGLISDIKSVEIRNNKSKIPKFTIQMYACFYDMLMDFPRCKFEQLKTITTKGMFTNFYRGINSKVHLHHSHVTGEIVGFVHDFCNWRVRENKCEIPLIGHNFLGFDIFYMVKGYRASCWGTDDFDMGATNLANVNYANIRNQLKIIDTLKYYQTRIC